MARGLPFFATLLLVACSSSTTAPTPSSGTPPVNGLVVHVSGLGVVQGHDTIIGGGAEYVCHYQLTAAATGGSAGQVATWGGGSERFTLASSGRMSNKAVAAADAFFGDQPVISTGTQVTGNDASWWVGPFSHSLTFYYSTPHTTTDSVTFSFRCQ
jgi:hypothetical protein